MYKYLLAFLLLPINSKAQAPYVDPILKPYVEEYLSDLRNHCIIPVNYWKIDSIKTLPLGEVVTKKDSSAEGICLDLKNKRHRVLIKTFYYTDTKEVDEKSYYRYIIYHELGHAIFDIVHPACDTSSIMYYTSQYNLYCRKYWYRAKEQYMLLIKKLLKK